MQSEIAARVDFSTIRYAQCWEDADVLIEGLDVQPGDVCLSIASGGDNTLALLTRGPKRVVALDLNPAQLACLELRVAAYRGLAHAELLELVGSIPSAGRLALYARLRDQLSPGSRQFWDARPRAIASGIGNAGKFEQYLGLFRRFVLPFMQRRARAEQLLQPRPPDERRRFYARSWDSAAWRGLFRLFFSRFLLGHLGRDPRLLRYVEGGVANHLLGRARYAFTVQDPSRNPYLRWIITGRHDATLPYALRPEHFDTIRANLDRLEWHCDSLEGFLERAADGTIDRFNLSDVFEYVSAEHYQQILERLARAGRPGGRLAYWNLLVPRSRPPALADRLRPLPEVAERLHRADKTFFYGAFVLEEIA